MQHLEGYVSDLRLLSELWMSISTKTTRLGMKHPWRLVCNEVDGRGWIRTNGWRDQNPLPYHLATPLMRRTLIFLQCNVKVNQQKARQLSLSFK